MCIRDRGKLLRPANFLGAAAIALPAGFDQERMPLAVQLLAPAGGDAALLDCAATLEPVLAPAVWSPDPVSYTHLDVYKRQFQAECWGSRVGHIGSVIHSATRIA